MGGEASALFEGSGVACRRGERLVFERLGFALGRGQALLLSGANGSGKSSLLKVMAGLVPAVAGTLSWAGRPLGADPADHGARLVYIGHADPVKPALTALENLAFWIALADRAPHAASPRVQAENALARLDLARLADRPARFLSAGQRRRLSLARLAAMEAPLWLLDEPTHGLDSTALVAFEGLLARHRGAGGLVVLASHVAIALPGAARLKLEDFAPRGETPS
jgi:heme exporter protein A